MQIQPPQLERLRELVALAQGLRRPNSYARNFDRSVAENAISPQILADYERDLRTLDAGSWGVLKAAAIKRLVRNKKKGWEPLFDLLNEAKAYAYLTALGCTDIQMIPHSYEYKTPDLSAELNGQLVLCEVKTINRTGDERMSSDHLSEEFLAGRLTRTVHAAKAQLDAFASGPARKIIYLVFAPDESWNDTAPQLTAFLREHPLHGVEVEIVQFSQTSPSQSASALPA